MWFIVDTEADGPCPGMGSMTALGVVAYDPTRYATNNWDTWRYWIYPMYAKPGDKYKKDYDEDAGGMKTNRERALAEGTDPAIAMAKLAAWIQEVNRGGRPVFVSDNPAFDFQWVNYYFWHFLGGNPFGHSARRIGDLACGINGSIYYQWKHLRETKHTHDPLDDAIGNAEALYQIFEHERWEGKPK